MNLVKSLFPEGYIEAAQEIIDEKKKIEKSIFSKYILESGFKKFDRGNTYLNLKRSIIFIFTKTELKKKDKVFAKLYNFSRDAKKEFKLVYGFFKPLKDSSLESPVLFENTEILVLAEDEFLKLVFDEDYNHVIRGLKREVKKFCENEEHVSSIVNESDIGND